MVFVTACLLLYSEGGIGAKGRFVLCILRPGPANDFEKRRDILSHKQHKVGPDGARPSRSICLTGEPRDPHDRG